jgi:hypothetical protein
VVTGVTLKIYHVSSMLGMTFGIPLSGDAVSSCGILFLVLKQGPAPDCWSSARVVKVESEADLDDRATVDAPGWSRLAVAGRARGPARLAVYLWPFIVRAFYGFCCGGLAGGFFARHAPPTSASR